MEHSRRNALRLGTGLGAVLLSGCAGLPFVDPELTLTLLNFDRERHLLNLEMLRADGTERSESIALHDEFELQAPTEGSAPYVLQHENLLDSRKYVVRAELVLTHSIGSDYIFYPDCTGGDEPPEELYVAIHRDEENERPYIRIQQNLCGRDAWQI